MIDSRDEGEKPFLEGESLHLEIEFVNLVNPV
jgi:hypothetical protein